MTAQHADRRAAGAPVLACIGGGARAQAVSRLAARLARERHVALLAIHVEAPGAPTRRAPAESELLAQNLRLAADLGARVEVISSLRVAETILSFARRHGVAVVVVGPCRRSRWSRLLEGDVVASLAARAAGFQLLVAEI